MSQNLVHMDTRRVKPRVFCSLPGAQKLHLPENARYRSSTSSLLRNQIIKHEKSHYAASGKTCKQDNDGTNLPTVSSQSVTTPMQTTHKGPGTKFYGAVNNATSDANASHNKHTVAAICCRLTYRLNVHKLGYAATIATGLFAKDCQKHACNLQWLVCVH